MGRIDEEYKKDMKLILNHTVGEYYRIYILYVLAPFIYPIYDDLVGNGFTDGLRIIPSFTELIIIEASVTFILILRLIRDRLLQKKIFPVDIAKNKLESAIKKITSLITKNKNSDVEYLRSLENIMQRNKELLYKTNT